MSREKRWLEATEERGMNRQMRRAVGKAAPAMPADMEKNFLPFLVERMLEAEGAVAEALRAAVGGGPTPGHMIDAAMNAAAAMDAAALRGDSVAYAKATVEALLHLRRLALSQGKMNYARPAEG